MSVSIFEYGDGRFRLFHGDREVGWVEGRAIGFADWDSEMAALRAATVAYDALCDWLARQRRQEAAPRRGRHLRTRTEGGERLLTLGGVAIGRLLRMSDTDASSDRHHGFELTLPPGIGAALGAAQIVDASLTRHRAFAELERVGASAEVLVQG
jgi:hypothetical protein